MASQPGNSPILVYNAKSFAQMLHTLRQRTLLALDTESDSLYSYYPKVCLIQISTYASAQPEGPLDVVDYLVDPLRLSDLTGLGELLATPGIETVMHAAENDMLILHRNYGFKFHCVFDTQLAARILGWQQVGLAAILEHQFEIVSDKRMQRTNWGKRPLMPQQIAYAQMDTHYLLALRSLLMEQLQARGRWEEAQDAFAHLVTTDYTQRIPEERSFWHMKSIRAVPRDRMSVLAALWQWREEEARRQNRPPFKIVNDSVLIELAQLTPKASTELSAIHGLSDLQIDRYGRVLLQSIGDSLGRPAPQPPEFEQRPDAELEKAAIVRFDILRKWRSEKAHQRDVAPDIILTNSTLLAIAQRNPATVAELSLVADLGPWKLKTYGPEILDAIQPYR